MTEGLHHFERSENLCGYKMMLRQVKNGVTAYAVNDVMLRINDVGSRPRIVVLRKNGLTNICFLLSCQSKKDGKKYCKKTESYTNDVKDLYTK